MAQAYTHAIGGVVLAQTAITFNVIPVGNVFSLPIDIVCLWTIGFLGATLPDYPAFLYLFYDKMRGIQPFTKQGPLIRMIIDMSHSVFLWVIVLVVYTAIAPHTVFGQWGILYFFCVLFAGILPDIPTHSEERFKDTDPSFVYPLDKFFHIEGIRWPNDTWEYRIDHGVLWQLKPWELTLNILMFVLFSFELLLFFT